MRGNGVWSCSVLWEHQKQKVEGGVRRPAALQERYPTLSIELIHSRDLWVDPSAHIYS